MKSYSDIEKTLSDYAQKASDTTRFKSVINTNRVILADREPKNTAVLRAVFNVAAVFLAAAVIGGVAFATSYLKDLPPVSSETAADDTDAPVTDTDTKEREYTPLPDISDYTFEGLHEIEYLETQFTATSDILPLSEEYENPRKLKDEIAKDFGYNVYLVDKNLYITNNKTVRTWLCITDKKGKLIADIVPMYGYEILTNLIYAEKSPTGDPVIVVTQMRKSDRIRSVSMYDLKTKAKTNIINLSENMINQEFAVFYSVRANKEENRIELEMSVTRSGETYVKEEIRETQRIIEQLRSEEDNSELIRSLLKEYSENKAGLDKRVYGHKYLTKTKDGYEFYDVEENKDLPYGTDKVAYSIPERTTNRKFVAVTSGGKTYYPDAVGYREGMRKDGTLEQVYYGQSDKDLIIPYSDDFDIQNNVYGKDYHIISIKVFDKLGFMHRSDQYLIKDGVPEKTWAEPRNIAGLKAYLEKAKSGEYCVSVTVTWDDGEVNEPGDIRYEFTYITFLKKE